MEDSLVVRAMLQLPPLLFAMVIHELAHAVTAYKLGDPTSKYLGRITLNPIAHVDLFTTILLPLFLILSGSNLVFAAAKPVPVLPTYFRDPKKGMMIVALAGPLSNLCLAIIFAIIMKYADIPYSPQGIEYGTIKGLFVAWIQISFFINIVLFVFNLIPIPPLDGSRVVQWILPDEMSDKYSRLESFGFIIVILLVSVPIVQQIFRFLILFLAQNIIFLIS